jgi:hypothetical protein
LNGEWLFFEKKYQREEICSKKKAIPDIVEELGAVCPRSGFFWVRACVRFWWSDANKSAVLCRWITMVRENRPDQNRKEYPTGEMGKKKMAPRCFEWVTGSVRSMSVSCQ